MDSLPNTNVSTPSSSPGLFSPTVNPIRQHIPSLQDGPLMSPYLHPLQMHKVRETHNAQVERDRYTGRKLINQYEIINEIGRGVHGKVKLARSLETGENVAIKIIQRYSKKRKLGKVTVAPEDKTKREIAILKKIRHPNVVGLLEVIDDPELKKIYMVLEHVELGEINWRKKGDPKICLYERRRIEKLQRGEKETGDDARYFKMIERRRERKDTQRAKATRQGQGDFWSLEHGADEDESMSSLSRQTTHESLENLSRTHRSLLRSLPGSRDPSCTPSRAYSGPSTRAHTPLPVQMDIGALDSDNEDDEPLPLPSIGSNHGSASALEGTYYGAYPEEPVSQQRQRAPSMADSIISHMSSIDDFPHDAFEDDFSYVPCFTIYQARETFRETVLGLEYLHYEGVVHRDIKPANLLWTRDRRVKISDFGVSYFGRPIREGETEENISEADATDFDDDLELAKTVGTPAFFAPELCYTDEDVEPPKVTEQIDVWSLGVTLYCLIYARLPFLAEDEWQLFRCIAKTEVYIPRQRLKAVNPDGSTPQLKYFMHSGANASPYREENELAYEDIDDELQDLLRRMLKKNPLERIQLREVKHHPWVLRHIPDIMAWLDDNDPSREKKGRRIQVNNNELDHAVVPITFLERAKSAMKKVVGKVVGVSKTEGSRRRAISSATSSGTDTRQHTPLPPTMRDKESRRSSLRGDESYFPSVLDLHDQSYHTNEHPLAQSVTVSPDIPAYEGDPFAHGFTQPAPVGIPSCEHVPSSTAEPDKRPGPPDRNNSTAASIQTVFRRGHSHSRSVTTPTKERMTYGERPMSPLFTDHSGALFGGHLWSPRGRESIAESDEGIVTRSHSVDRTLFTSEDKHGEPSVAISTATAPGLFQHPLLHHPRPISRSTDASPTHDYDGRLPSPMFFSPYVVSAHQQNQSQSTPNVRKTGPAASDLDDRPSTANRTPEGKTPVARAFGANTPESFQRTKDTLARRQRLEAADEDKRQELARHMAASTSPASDDVNFPRAMTDESDAACRAGSYSSVNSSCLASQMTSPNDDLTSPLSSVNLGSKSQLQFFPSEPSLPALVSGGSSVSADTEGDMLQRPGSVHGSSPESLTPPCVSQHREKEVIGEEGGTTPIPAQSLSEDPFFLSPEDEEGYNADGDTPASKEVARDESDDDSDDGLVMTRRKPRKQSTVTAALKRESHLERRNTAGSSGSADTAEKVMTES